MKKVLVIAAVTALAAAAVWATPLGYDYAGKWGENGSGNGQFNSPMGVTLATNGYVYVGDWLNNRVQYFTSTGGYVGQWRLTTAFDLEFGPNGYVYVTNWDGNYVHYFTSTGSLVGSWTAPFNNAGGVGIATNGDVYVADCYNHVVRQFTSTGSAIRFFGSGYVLRPLGVDIASNGNVYVGGFFSNNVAYFTSAGSFLGSWGGPIQAPGDVDVGPRDEIFVGGQGTSYVYFFTSTGSLLGSFGGVGSEPGKFSAPAGIDLTADGTYVYVADQNNHRVQYFQGNVSVIPASLGRVKALFR